MALERSKAMGLAITLTGDSWYEEDYIALVKEHRHRWKTVVVAAEDAYIPGPESDYDYSVPIAHALLDIGPFLSDTPCLTHLDVRLPEDLSDRVPLPASPELIYISVAGLSFTLNSVPQDDGLPCLKVLKMTRFHSDNWSIIRRLIQRGHQTLEHLGLSDYKGSEDAADEDDGETWPNPKPWTVQGRAELHELRTLRMVSMKSGNIVSLLRWLKAGPLLESIHVSVDTREEGSPVFPRLLAMLADYKCDTILHLFVNELRKANIALHIHLDRNYDSRTTLMLHTASSSLKPRFSFSFPLSDPTKMPIWMKQSTQLRVGSRSGRDWKLQEQDYHALIEHMPRLSELILDRDIHPEFLPWLNKNIASTMHACTELKQLTVVLPTSQPDRRNRIETLKNVITKNGRLPKQLRLLEVVRGGKKIPVFW